MSTQKLRAKEGEDRPEQGEDRPVRGGAHSKDKHNQQNDRKMRQREEVKAPYGRGAVRGVLNLLGSRERGDAAREVVGLRREDGVENALAALEGTRLSRGGGQRHRAEGTLDCRRVVVEGDDAVVPCVLRQRKKGWWGRRVTQEVGGAGTATKGVIQPTRLFRENRRH